MIEFTVGSLTKRTSLLGALRHNGISATMRRKIKHNGICKINDIPATWRDFVVKGDKVTVDLPIKQFFDPEPMDLDIVYEDDYLLLINKPHGLLMHPTSGHAEGTLANGVLYYYQQTKQRCAFHPMHRLDRNTSGIVMLAKQPQIQYAFSRKHLFYNRFYLAITSGYFPSSQATVHFPISRSPESIVKRIISKDGKPAWSDFKRIAANTEYSLILVTLHTGRTHQIRVHCSNLGYPLLGDDLYGGSKERISRQALHAYCVQFTHPVTGKIINIMSPVPADMQKLIQEAGWDDMVKTTLGGIKNAISNN